MMGIHGGEYASINSEAPSLHRSPKEVESATDNPPSYNEMGNGENNSLELPIEDAIERLGMGKFQRRILWAAGLCFAADSMEILLLSFLMVVLQQEWGLTDTQSSFITSSVFAGALIGSLTLGPLGDMIGRKPVFAAAAIIISTFGLATALAYSFASLLLVRFIVGFGVGGLTVPFDTLSEFLPASHRGINLLNIEYFWTFGSLLVPILAYFTLGNERASGSWQLFVILCAIPCVISAILGLLVVPESPRWLCARGRSEEALVVLREAAVINGRADPMMLFPEGTMLTTEEEHSSIRDLFSPQWKWIMLRLWGASCGMAFLYYGAILAVTMIFSSDESKQTDGTYNFDYTAIFASSSAELVGLTLVIFIVDTVGRIPSQAFCYVLGGSSVFFMCTFASMDLPRAILLVCSFSSRLFMMGATCLTWVSTSEILTTEIRTTGHSAANAVARIGGFVSPYIVSEQIPLLYIGVLMLGASLATAHFVSKLPETKGVGMGVATVKAHQSEHDAITELSSSMAVPSSREII